MEFHNISFFCYKEEPPTCDIDIDNNDIYWPAAINIDNIHIYFSSIQELINFKISFLDSYKQAMGVEDA